MAIAFRAIATAFENGSSTIVCNVPTGTQDNDGMLLSVTLRNNYTVTTPSGWTLVGSALSGTASESCRKYVYSRVASSEPASYTITCSNVSEVVAEMVSYSGTATTGLVDASLGTTAYNTTTSLTADAITTTVANTMIVAFSAADMNGQTGFSVTPPSGMTERAETASTGTRKHLCTTSDVAQASAGTTGARSATLSSTPLIVYKACFLVALAPMPGPITATTPAQLRALVEASDLEIDWSMALYDSSDAYVADITADVEAATITRNLYRTIHGTATFRLSRQLLWGSQRLAPSVALTSEAENLTATWALGRWLTSIPTRVVGATPESYEVEAYDKLLLADTKVGRSYAVASGTSYITAVETILGTELGEASYALDQASAATVTTSTLNWLLDDETTWLRIINDLLIAINYEGLWVDRDGRYRSRPYRDPDERTTSWYFDADDAATTIVGETRTVVPARQGEDISDPIDTPNTWVFVNDDIAQAPPTVGAGIYQQTNDTDGPTSVAARGQTVYSIQLGTFSSQSALLTYGQGRVGFARYRFNSHLELDTGPCPPLWHFDVVDLIDSALGPQRRWAVEEWTLDLPSGDMSHRWRDVQGVT